MQETLGWEDPWRRDTHSSLLVLLCWLRHQRIHLQCGGPGFDPWLGKSPWRKEQLPLQYSCLENSMDRGAWQVTVHEVTKNRTRLGDFHFMATSHYFLPRSKRLLISWLQSPSAMILESTKRKYFTVSISSFSICHEVMAADGMILAFWMLNFKPGFLLSSFTLIKRFFSSSSLSVIRVVWSAYLRLLLFLPAILISACNSSNPAFPGMYSA